MDLLGQVPNLIVRFFVQPVVEGAVELVGAVSANLLGEFAFETGEYIVELESVC